jgi:PEGA domain
MSLTIPSYRAGVITTLRFLFAPEAPTCEMVDNKVRNYTVETSSYIGPLKPRDESTSPASEKHSPEPGVKLAVEKSGQSNPSPKAQSDQTLGSNEATVLFSSDPSGADIYVDGSFIGEAPSQIQLSAGSHSVRVGAKGKQPWTREITVTPGGKITIHAALEARPQT